VSTARTVVKVVLLLQSKASTIKQIAAATGVSEVATRKLVKQLLADKHIHFVGWDGAVFLKTGGSLPALYRWKGHP
jgi:response regulator of citrate/malate metabolism